MSRVILVIMLVAGIAHGERIDLADHDPELQRALTASLAPWKAEVVVVDDRETATARFVVWRETDELVVRDRERGTIERRASHGGALDPIAAAAAALTVKTMLNLPPIDQGGDPPPAILPASQPLFAVEIGGGGRFAGDVGGARGVAAVFVKPTVLALRAGLAAEIGTSTTVDKAGFKGSWSDWSLRAIAGWPIDRGVWTIEPRGALGFVRSSLDGTEKDEMRHEAATLFVVGAGVAGWRRIDRFRVGVVLDLQWIASTPTYTKDHGNGEPEVFRVPNTVGTIGIAVATDFGL